MVKNAWKWPKDRFKEKMLKEFFPGYYNNFEIVRLEAFRTPQIREWFAEIVSVPERIYKYRWGQSAAHRVPLLPSQLTSLLR